MRTTRNYNKLSKRRLISVRDRLDKGDEINFIRDFDYLLMGVVLIISIIGLVMLASASENMYKDKGAQAMIVQVVGLVIGFGCAMVMAYMDYYLFRLFCFPFYLANIFLIFFYTIKISVYTGMGSTERRTGRK